MTGSPSSDHYQQLRITHHKLLLRAIGYRRQRGTYRQLSYAKALKIVGCQSVEATLSDNGACSRRGRRLDRRIADSLSM